MAKTMNEKHHQQRNKTSSVGIKSSDNVPNGIKQKKDHQESGLMAIFLLLKDVVFL